MPWISILLLITILILFNALYVAAEFSAISARRPRLSQIAGEDYNLAKSLLSIIEDPQKLDNYVAACQVGITISSLLLGFSGRGQVESVLSPWLAQLGEMSKVTAQSISITIILLLLTLLQVLIGEIVPKNIGIQYPEKLALLTLIPMRWSIAVFKPLIWLFNGSGSLIMRIFGQEIATEHVHIHAPEEILILVEESGEGGVLRQEERRLLKNTLQLRESMVRQVMIPRTRMMSASDKLTGNEMLKLIADSPYSRFPINKGTIDNIVGVIHIKDLLCLDQHAQNTNVGEIMRPVPFVPETMPVKTVFSLLQRKHFQVAIVLDEFGGTAGMVTLEDLIEEIFGELQDEFDTYIPPLRVIIGNWLWIRGDTLVSEINETLELDLPDDEVDTIGGLVLNAFGDVPSVGSEVVINTNKFKVEKMSGRGVSAISLQATAAQIKRLQEGVS